MSGSVSVLIILGVVVVILLISIIRLGKNDFRFLADRMAARQRKSFDMLKPCPVCSTLIGRGERVHSVYYRQKQGDHQLLVEEIHTEIYGCPYCWPSNAEHPRTCPVCRQTVSSDGYLVARTFRKPGQKDHVHVIGCTECKTVR